MPTSRRFLASCFFALAALKMGLAGHPSDPIAGRTHWAFQPLKKSRPEPSAWGRSAIDDFLLAKWKEAKLRPNGEATRRELLRRASFQLLGLPPSAEKLASFLADDHPQSFERAVDAMLESPRFGERWGRHWLDLARYADSNGLDENFLFREAWRYRNWIIAKLNADLPLDRFILEQVAGDLLPHDSIEQRDQQRIAAGFLVMGPKVLLGNDPRRQRMEVADEQLDTIGKSLLGMTLGCARCHDHKFDPIPTADYYAMAGILTSTQVVEQRHMLNEQRVMERLVGLGPKGDELNAAYEKFWREMPQAKERVEKAKAALDLLKKKDEAAWKALLEKHPAAIADAAKDTAQAHEKRVEAQKAHMEQLAKALANPPKIPPRAMIPAEAREIGDEFIRVAGQFDRKGAQVPRGFLQVVSDQARPKLPEKSSGRVELGRWLTDVDNGAGYLTARVLANRVWHHLMGRGLVRTMDNFGRTGEPPSHPELLDYLAARLIASGWSLKALAREIVLSRAFALSSAHSAEAHEIDPDNRLLWRGHRRRLDPESLRDAMLATASELELKRVESTVWYLGDQATAVGKNEVRRRTDFPYRSVYLPMIRNDLPELFQAFDFADPHATTGARPKTTAATQGLYLLNDTMVMNTSEAAAKRLLAMESDTIKRVDALFMSILSSPPTEDERKELLLYITETESRLSAEGEKEPRLRAWALACQAVYSSSRFQYLD